MLDQKYNCVDSIDKLKALNNILMLNDNKTPRSRKLALDTETNGLNIIKNTVVGISLANSKNRGFYIPLLKWVQDTSICKSRTKKGIKYDKVYPNGHLECIWTGKTFSEFVTPQEYNFPERFPLIPALIKRWTENANLRLWNLSFDVNMIRQSLKVDIISSVKMDGSLLVHILDENFPTALKANVGKYREVFGLDPYAIAATEKKELETSIIVNGGNKAGEVWRADLEVQSKYACADAFYTFGICDEALREFEAEYGKTGLKWFVKDEVMSLATEVVTDMKQKGVYINAPYFEKLLVETQNEMQIVEDKLISVLNEEVKLKDYFTLGKEEEVSKQRLLKKIIELEGLNMPTKTNLAGKIVPSLAKGVVKKAYEKNPHWVFGYILGTEELKYSEEKIEKIHKELHYEAINKTAIEEKKPIKRYLFNINSDLHLRWLFCDHLGMNPKVLPGTDSSKPDNIIPSMKAEVLKEFMLPKYKWVEILLSYKKLIKLESTYIRPAVILNEDGWLLMDMRQNGTVNGRFSCSGGYNLQTLPRVDDEQEMLEACEECNSENVKVIEKIAVIADLECLDCRHIKTDIVRPSAIKRGFIAPPGYKIVSADYSSLEPKCFAFCSGSDDLKEVFWKGLDLYSQVYCKIFDKKGEFSADPKDDNYLKKVAKVKRQWSKSWVLGIPYGAEAGQVAMATNSTIEVKDKDTGEPIKIPDMKEGQRIIDEYLNAFPDLKDYMHRQELQAVTFGYVETLLGRKRHLPKAKIIQDILIKYGFDFQDLRSCVPKDLKKEECTPINKKSGVRVFFSSDALKDMCVALKIDEETIKEKNYWVFIRGILRSELNNAKNSPIQGLAAHITNRAMLDTTRLLKGMSLDAWVALQIHDELICYSREEHAEKTAKCLQHGMEKNKFAMMLDIPMVAIPVMCDNLAEAK